MLIINFALSTLLQIDKATLENYQMICLSRFQVALAYSSVLLCIFTKQPEKCSIYNNTLATDISFITKIIIKILSYNELCISL